MKLEMFWKGKLLFALLTCSPFFETLCRECFSQAFDIFLTSVESLHKTLPDGVAMAKLIPQITNEANASLLESVVDKLVPLPSVAKFCDSVFVTNAEPTTATEKLPNK